MSFEYIQEGSSDFNDETIIAILIRDDVKITFIKVDDELMSKDFDCLSWFETEMLIGISESYVDDVLDESIAEQLSDIAHEMGDKFTFKLIEKLSVDLLTPYLQDILSAVMVTSNPDASSIDRSLNRILHED